MSSQTTGHRPPLLALVTGLTAALTVALVAFAWPPSQMEPREVPLVVAGPPGTAEQVAGAFDAALGEDAFAVTAVGSRREAVSALEEREAYGAVVLSPTGSEMLVASAASPVVAQLLAESGARMAEQAGTAPAVTDVVPLPAADPRGAVFGAGAFPLVIGGILVGAALAVGVAGRTRQAVAGVVVAATSGLSLAAVQQLWLGALDGSYWANAAVYALAVAAMAAVVVGMHRVLGKLGLGLTAATILLLGNPLSAITSAPELLPEGWSTLGRLLPPGAAGSALRSTAFFDGAGATAPTLVLLGWLLVGLALAATPSRQDADRRTGAGEEVMVEPQPATTG